MATHSEGSGRRHHWRILGWGSAVALLMLPFVAMQFTSEVKWSASSFVFAGVLIGGVGAALELAVRMSTDIAYRFGAGIALLAAFLIIWVNLAVGIVGSEDNPVNLSFFMLVAMAAVGACAAGFRAVGMARAMFGVATVQTMLGAIVSTGPVAAREPAGGLGLFALNGVFVLLWLLSGALFARAARADIK